MPRTARTARNLPPVDDPEGDPAPGSPEWRMAVGQPADDADEAPEETAQDRVAVMLQDMRHLQSAKVKLYRKSSTSKKLTWCADYTADEFEAGGFAMVRNTWGPGDYEIRLYGERDGTFGVLGRSEIELAAPLVPVASAPNALPSGLEQFLQAQQQFNTQLLEAVTKKPDPMSSMKEMFGMMTMMREAMGLNNQASQKSSIAEIMEAVREMRAVAEEINPRPEREDDPDNPMAIVGKIADLVGQAMRNPAAAAQLQQSMPGIALPPALQAPVALPDAPAPVAPVASPVATPDQTEQEAEMSVEDLRAEFSKVLAIGVQWQATKSPELVAEAADRVYEFLPDEMVEPFRSEQWFDMLRLVDQSVSVHQEFLTLVRAETLSFFDEDANDAPAP